MITIRKYHPHENALRIHLPKAVLDALRWREVVVREVSNEIHIREALLWDHRRSKITAKGQFNYDPPHRDDLVGDYQFEVENDTIILFKQ